MIAPTLGLPVVAQAARDRRLSLHERLAVLVLWQELSTAEYRPMKGEALAHLLGIRRQSAIRILNRLVDFGYLHATRPQTAGPRFFLLVNVVTMPAAA